MVLYGCTLAQPCIELGLCQVVLGSKSLFLVFCSKLFTPYCLYNTAYIVPQKIKVKNPCKKSYHMHKDLLYFKFCFIVKNRQAYGKNFDKKPMQTL